MIVALTAANRPHGAATTQGGAPQLGPRRMVNYGSQTKRSHPRTPVGNHHGRRPSFRSVFNRPKVRIEVVTAKLSKSKPIRPGGLPQQTPLDRPVILTFLRNQSTAPTEKYAITAAEVRQHAVGQPFSADFLPELPRITAERRGSPASFHPHWWVQDRVALADNPRHGPARRPSFGEAECRGNRLGSAIQRQATAGVFGHGFSGPGPEKTAFQPV